MPKVPARSFNREGDLLFTMAKDKRPTVWWADDGQRFGTYVGHDGAVMQARHLLGASPRRSPRPLRCGAARSTSLP